MVVVVLLGFVLPLHVRLLHHHKYQGTDPEEWTTHSRSRRKARTTKMLI